MNIWWEDLLVVVEMAGAFPQMDPLPFLNLFDLEFPTRSIIHR